MKCDVIKRKEEPKRVKERPTAPLVLMRVPGLVAKLAVHTAVMVRKINLYPDIFYLGLKSHDLPEQNHMRSLRMYSSR